MAVEHGAVREIWLAPLSNPSSKSSFLIRDDARSKSGATFGRTLRLGDPVSLGPNSTWKQTSWVGGLDQEIWRDEEMYHSGSVDAFADAGKIKLHRTIGELLVVAGRTNTNRIALGRNATGTRRPDPTYLFMGEDYQDHSGTPSGGFRLYRSVPGSGVSLIKSDFDAGITSFSPVDDGSTSLYIGTKNGKVWRYDQPSGSFTLDYTDPSGAIAPNSMMPYGGSLFWLAGSVLRKRTWSPSSTSTQTITISGSPTGGSFTLRYNGETTNAIPFNASAAAVEMLIAENTGLTDADLDVSGANGGPWTVTFAATNVPMLQLASNSLTGGSSPTVKITPAAAGTKYEALGPLTAAARAQGICVWNNRLWLGSMTMGRRARIHVSDGVTVTEAFQFPDEFEIYGLIPYNGSLYIYGSRAGADRISTVGQVWRYTGSTLSKIWESGNGEDGDDHTVYDAIVDRGVLYWTKNATGSDLSYGLMAYDSELDAIYMGPNENLGAELLVRSVEIYNQTLVLGVSNKATGDWAVRPIAELGVVKRDTGTVTRWLLSSRYDGELPGEEKVWLKARIRVKIPSTGCSVRLAVILDEGSEQQVGTISFDAGRTGWRTETIALKASGSYLRSTTIQYKLYLENANPVALDTGNPSVDSIEVDFLPAPVKRRQWQVMALASDGQDRLDGNPNPLSSAGAIESAIEDFWGDQEPFLFWDADMDPDVDTGIEVMPLTFSSQSARVVSDSNEVLGFISFGFVEVV